MNEPIIKFHNVSRSFKNGEDIALHDTSLEISAGEFVCFIGPSGAGKSTILNLIAGLEQPTTGEVVKPADISMVFQSGALLPWLTVLDNVALGLRDMPLAKRRAESKKYLELTGLGGFESKYPRDLSGGQRQRVGLARALAVNPSILLLDEPFSALDPHITEALHHDIINIWEHTGKTVLMVSHSIEEAVALADRVVLVKNHAIDKIFSINLPRPRREQEASFAHEVSAVRREFFKS